jgi:thiamine kinase-like enzyme
MLARARRPCQAPRRAGNWIDGAAVLYARAVPVPVPSPVELRRIAERVPEWRGHELSAEPLAGGLTNLNYRVRGGPVDDVLRVTGPAELLGADREAEYAATTLAAGLDLAPLVVTFLRPERMLITRFVDGRGIEPAELRAPAMLHRVGLALRRLHEAPAVSATFSPFAILERYAEAARGLGVPEPDELPWARELAARLHRLRDDAPGPCLCHNDLLNANFLLEGERLRIVDWEYAGMGDPYFDLANFSSNHDLDEDDDMRLLEAHFGSAGPSELARLRLMRVLSDLREAMWGVVQQGLRTTDTDYEGYARVYFERMRRRAQEPGFERHLEAIS